MKLKITASSKHKIISGCTLFLTGVAVGYGLFALREFKNSASMSSVDIAGNYDEEQFSGLQVPGKNHEADSDSGGKIKNLQRQLSKIKKDVLVKKAQVALLRGMIDDRMNDEMSLGQSVRHYLVSQDITPADLSFALKPFLSIDQKSTNEDRDLIEAAVALSEIAARGILFAASAEENDPPYNCVDISFSESVDQNNVSINASMEFYADDVVKIYASFDTQMYPEKEVLVKWYKTDEHELLIFNKYRIDCNKDHNYVWLQKRHSWDPGRYTVEIYSVKIEDNIKMIARGSYTIW